MTWTREIDDDDDEDEDVRWIVTMNVDVYAFVYAGSEEEAEEAAYDEIAPLLRRGFEGLGGWDFTSYDAKVRRAR